MSLNAVKHGLTSTKMFVLQNENPAAWAELLDQCVNDYKPTTPLEITYVLAIAFSLQAACVACTPCRPPWSISKWTIRPRASIKITKRPCYRPQNAGRPGTPQ